MPDNKILIVHLGALGDLVAAFPALIRLKEQFHRIDILCQNQLGKLACELDIADSCFPVESASVGTLYSKTVDPKVENFLQAYQAIILFSFSEMLEETIKKITQNPVYRISPRPEASKRIHVTEYLLNNLKQRNLIDISIPPITDKRNPDFNQKTILLHPGSGSRKKNWPFIHFLKLYEALKAEDFKPMFILGPAEHELNILLQKDTESYTISNLSQLTTLLKTSGRFIGNDSGVSHLAAFIGIPTIAIFGPSDPVRWKPMGKTVKAVTLDMSCSPCFETDKNNCGAMECLNRISPEMVLSIFHEQCTKD